MPGSRSSSNARLAALTSVPVALPVFPIAADAPDVNKPVTFAKDIAPIFQEKCQECHRAGSMAPMSLVTYEETRPWAKSIRQRVISRQMPPWHIDKTVGVQHFKNDMSLSDEQISAIVRWVDSGAPPGNAKTCLPRSSAGGRKRMESCEGTGRPGSGRQVRSLHHGSSPSGRMVETVD